MVLGQPIRRSSVAGALLSCCLLHSSAQASPPYVRAHALVRAICTGGAVRSESIREVRATDSAVWVATDEVFLQFRDGSWRRWTPSEGYPARAVSAMDVDAATEEVWLGTWGDGLIRFSGGRFERFDQLNSGLAGNLVFAVVSTNRRIYAATNGGVSVFDPVADEWELYFARKADGRQPIISQLLLNGTEMFARSWEGIIFRLDAGTGEWVHVLDAPRLGWDPEDCSPSSAMARGRSSSPASGEAPKIALFSGANRHIALPDGGTGSIQKMRRPDALAVQLAVEAANLRAPQSEGHDIELREPTPGYASYGWGLPEDEFISFIDDPLILGIVGTLGDRDSLLDAVVCRTGLPFVNAPTLAPETGSEMEGNPWHFRCWGDLPRQHRRFIDHALDDLRLIRFAIVQTPGEATKRHLAWWRGHLAARGHSPVLDSLWQPGLNDETILETLRDARPDVVLTWCDGVQSAKLLKAIRRIDDSVWFLGSGAIVNNEFAAQSGSDENRVLALQASPLVISSGDWGDLAKRYSDRGSSRNFPVVPDEIAYQSFLATDHLATAIQQSAQGDEQLGNTLRGLELSHLGESHYERMVAAEPLIFARLQSGQWVRQTIPAKQVGYRTGD